MTTTFIIYTNVSYIHCCKYSKLLFAVTLQMCVRESQALKQLQRMEA